MVRVLTHRASGSRLPVRTIVRKGVNKKIHRRQILQQAASSEKGVMHYHS
jgi:hypothetical protein